MKLLPFDFEKYTNGYKAITRNLMEVNSVYFYGLLPLNKLVYVVNYHPRRQQIYIADVNGRLNDSHESPFDLMLVDPNQTKWVAVLDNVPLCNNPEYFGAAVAFDSKEKAMKAFPGDVFKFIEIELK